MAAKHYVINNKLLGSGSFGGVYSAEDQNHNLYAIKCCDVDDKGIPNILEASIMTSIIHPSLNHALDIYSTDSKLYIIQDLAVSDLFTRTNRHRSNYIPSLNELQYWCFTLAQAVSVLHSENIIHADIKSNNVLLYADGSIKLTDFTLARIKNSPSDTFSRTVCTCTHRPLECLLRKPWNESLDIWSLGCTFYELAYGEHLFPYQGNLRQDHKILKDRKFKERLRRKSIAALLDWNTHGPSQRHILPFDIDPINIPHDFVPFSLSPRFTHPSMEVFNSLITSMLCVNPSLRPSISSILSHPFFKTLSHRINTDNSYITITRPEYSLSTQEFNRIHTIISSYTDNIFISKLSFSLYCRCINLDSLSESLRIFVCTWLALKINSLPLPSIPHKFSLDDIISAELSICHNLRFHLH